MFRFLSLTIAAILVVALMSGGIHSTTAQTPALRVVSVNEPAGPLTDLAIHLDNNQSAAFELTLKLQRTGTQSCSLGFTSPAGTTGFYLPDNGYFAPFDIGATQPFTGFTGLFGTNGVVNVRGIATASTNSGDVVPVLTCAGVTVDQNSYVTITRA